VFQAVEDYQKEQLDLESRFLAGRLPVVSVSTAPCREVVLECAGNSGQSSSAVMAFAAFAAIHFL
jgi:hypothetical protein